MGAKPQNNRGDPLGDRFNEVDGVAFDGLDDGDRELTVVNRLRDIVAEARQ